MLNNSLLLNKNRNNKPTQVLFFFHLIVQGVLYNCAYNMSFFSESKGQIDSALPNGQKQEQSLVRPNLNETPVYL